MHENVAYSPCRCDVLPTEACCQFEESKIAIGSVRFDKAVHELRYHLKKLLNGSSWTTQGAAGVFCFCSLRKI